MDTRSQRKKQADPEDEVSTSQLLKLLAKHQEVLANMVQNVQLTSTSTAAPGNPTSTPALTVGPTAVKFLPAPKLQSPENLNICQFRDWTQRWEDYYRASQIQHHTVETQHGILRSVLDTEWTMLWNTVRLQITPTSSISDVIKAMESYLRRRRNPLLDRQQFHRRDQMAGESVDRYYAALKSLDDAGAHEEEFQCTYCTQPCITECTSSSCGSLFPLVHYLQEIRIRDRLICGLRDKEMQRKVLAEQYTFDLTLERVLSTCTAMETSVLTGDTLNSTNASAPEVHYTSFKKSSYKKQNQSKPSYPPQSNKDNTPTSSPPSSPCKGCGKSGHARKSCKSWTHKCEACGKIGHYKSVCFREKNQDSYSNSSPTSTQQPRKSSNSCNTSNHQLLNVLTTIDGTPHFLRWLPNTGAEVDEISLHDLSQLGSHLVGKLKPDAQDVVTANGESLGPVGSIKATLNFNNHTYNTILQVYRYVTTPLLSKQGCIALGLLGTQWPYSQMSTNAIFTGQPQIIQHRGKERTLQRARQSVFWPSISNDVINTVKTCRECASHLPSQPKEPLKSDPTPDYPFQSVATDIFSYAGYEYLGLVDRFSGWLNIAKCGRSSSTSTVVHILKRWMTDFGIPEKLRTDNGPQFSSFEFANFARKWGIHHFTSSPHYRQSNGLAESTVKALKYLLQKTSSTGDLNSEEFQLGLLELRNTPRASGRPAQVLFGTPIRSTLPLHRSRFCQEWKENASKSDDATLSLKEKAEEQYNATAHPLEPLSRGDSMLNQDHRTHEWNKQGTIVEVINPGRSYQIRTPSGRILRRNRRFPRRFTPPSLDAPPLSQKEELRRSPRLRAQLHTIGCSPRSHLKGGHVVVSSFPKLVPALKRTVQGTHKEDKRKTQPVESCSVSG